MKLGFKGVAPKDTFYELKSNVIDFIKIWIFVFTWL
jgi:hypothetical protein